MDNRTVLEQVHTGYRMGKPRGTPDSLYDVMLDCWHKDPDKRPTFDFLASFLNDYFTASEPNYREADETWVVQYCSLYSRRETVWLSEKLTEISWANEQWSKGHLLHFGTNSYFAVILQWLLNEAVCNKFLRHVPAINCKCIAKNILYAMVIKICLWYKLDAGNMYWMHTSINDAWNTSTFITFLFPKTISLFFCDTYNLSLQLNCCFVLDKKVGIGNLIININ